MKKILELLTAAGGAIASFFINMPPLVYILIAVMTIDYITGLICGAMGLSPKTENGYLKSHEAFKGLMKKCGIIVVVLLASLTDMAVTKGMGIQVDAVLGAVCLWFIGSEGLSILENVARMGVPVPKILLRLLEIMKDKGNGPEDEQPAAEEQQDG